MNTPAQQSRTTADTELPTTSRPALALVSPGEGSAPDRFIDYFHGKDLVQPARPAPPVALPTGTAVTEEMLLAELSIARTFARNAMAKSTRYNYGHHVRKWITWCDERGIDPLVEDPRWIAAHIGAYAVQRSEDGTALVDEDGAFLRAHEASSVNQRLAAINKFYEYAGKPAPGADETVKAVMRAIRRGFTMRPRHAKAALDLAGLKSCLAAATGEWRALRDTLVLLLRQAGLTAGQIARLDWVGVQIGDDRVTVEAAPRYRHDTLSRLVLPAHLDPALDPVRLFARYKSLCPLLAAVFTRRPADSSGLSRQAITNLAGSLAERAGGYTALPGLPDGALRGLLPGHDDSTGKATRDRAVLLTGWYPALRRSNLSGLNWGDLRREKESWEVLLRRSKTDQEGHGSLKYLVTAPAGNAMGLPCPVEAMDAWHARVTDLLGADPISAAPETPVFIRFTATGPDLAGGRVHRMSGEATNLLIQDLAVDAGLCKRPQNGARHPYGGHSLRVGFVTEMLTGNKLSIHEVRSITDHKSLDVLMRYHRDVNAATNSPVARLIAGLTTGT